MAADRMAKELLGIATADDAPPAVKLAAIRDALDRAGLSPKTAVEIEVGPTKAYESLLTDMLEGGSRAASRAARGVPDEVQVEDDEQPEDEQTGWTRAQLEDAIDAEVVDEPEPLPEPPAPNPPHAATEGGLIPMEDALDQLHATAPPPVPQARRRRGR